jgi:hypothetical protein
MFVHTFKVDVVMSHPSKFVKEIRIAVFEDIYRKTFASL